MRIYGEHWLRPGVAQKLIAGAPRGEFNGIMDAANADYLERQKAFHASMGILLIFTRDSGHHTSGWFKNPQFERCLHLSVSFREPFRPDVQASFDECAADEWVDLVFGESKRFVWTESPKSAVGRRLEVMHYRVFTDEFWRPINPRGEVYSTELTEKGWKSWSEQHPNAPEPSTPARGVNE